MKQRELSRVRSANACLLACLLACCVRELCHRLPHSLAPFPNNRASIAVAVKAVAMPEARVPPIGLRNISGNLEADMAASRIAKEAILKTTP